MEVEDSSQLNESIVNQDQDQQCETQNDISASGKRGSDDSNLSNNNENELVSPTTKGEVNNKLFQDRRRLRKNNNENATGGYNKEWMDIERKNIQAYEYLCHVEEARDWIERCIGEEIDSKSFEEQLRRGVILAKLAKIIKPEVVKKIFDAEKLQYRHSDNINYLFEAMKKINFPENFIFELTDLYDKKNIPKVIYCLHALSHYLEVTGFLHPAVKNFVGKLEFSEEELNNLQEDFKASGIILPQFRNVEAAVQKEISNSMANLTSDSEKKPLTEEEKRDLYYRENVDKIIKVQSAARGYIARKEYDKEYGNILKNKDKIIKIQATMRCYLQMKKYNERKKYFKEHEASIVKLQSMVRGKKARQKYLDRKNYYERNIDKIIKVQSYVRRFLAMKCIKELKSGKTTSHTVHRYLKLMGDNSLDFDYESEMEFLRELAIRKIRENIELEKEVNALDIKIELLVKNKISIQEVFHASKKKKKNAPENETVESIFTSKTPDKESRRKFKLYQNLFYLVQTNQKYLAKLMIKLNSIGSSQIKTIENTVMSLYGYAQNNREEYLLLNLIKKTIEYEVEDIHDINDFWRVNPIFIKLVLHYCRGAKEQQYLRDLLQPLIKSVITCDGLELESNPVAIYKNIIREAEFNSGQKPDKKYDVDAKEALSDEETKKAYINHLQKLREITNKFLDAIIASLPNMPYSIRCIAMELSTHFMEKWPNNQADVTKILGNLIYYRYINPVICAPEGFDIIESNINQIQRKNLAEIAKLLHNISVNKPFADDNQWLQPLNEYIAIAAKKFAIFFNKVACVESAEVHYQIDEFDDLAKTSNPVIYISPKEIIEVHQCIIEHIEDVETNEKDPLRIILKDLGDPVTTETSEKEIQLTLVNIFADVNDDGNSEMNRLYKKTKNMVLDIILIQNGKSILDALNRPTTEDLEYSFKCLIKQKIIYEKLLKEKIEQERKELENPNIKLSTNTNPDHDSNDNNDKPNTNEANENTNPQDQDESENKKNLTKIRSESITQLKNITFAEYKKMTKENLEKLEGFRDIKKENEYQALLTIITKEIINKNIHRKQRIAEIQKLKQTIGNLKQKEDYLLSQKTQYHQYIDGCMAKLSDNKKPKPTIFSRQYYYLKKLEKEGKVPKFGSYQYTAEQLHKRQILESINGVNQKLYGAIKFTISSDEVGIFNIVAKAKLFDPTEITITLDELLDARYNEIQTLTICDGLAKVNVNLLLHLINKKFYS
jgi:hypothetical protein